MDRRRRWVVRVLAGAIVAVLAALLLPRADPLHAGLVALARDDRAHLFERTLENVRFCGARKTNALARFCDQEASLAMAFPECDEQCRQLAQPSMGRSFGDGAATGSRFNPGGRRRLLEPASTAGANSP
jgi:hypothetical protein